MKPEDAAKKLSFHLMQCGMMMPMEWVKENGEGSALQQAFRMALDALRDNERLQAELEQVKQEKDAAIRAIYTLIADCPPEVCREICANYDGVCSEHAKIGHYDHCKGFKWIGEKEG